jgi:hypothetical protein
MDKLNLVIVIDENDNITGSISGNLKQVRKLMQDLGIQKKKSIFDGLGEVLQDIVERGSSENAETETATAEKDKKQPKPKKDVTA